MAEEDRFDQILMLCKSVGHATYLCLVGYIAPSRHQS